jgi:hypothetical protein
MPRVGVETAIPASKRPYRLLFISIRTYYMLLLTVDRHYIVGSLYENKGKLPKIIFLIRNTINFTIELTSDEGQIKRDPVAHLIRGPMIIFQF